MAELNLTAPVADGDTVTAQTLHDMIETATLTSITGADLAPGSTVIIAQSSSPDPSLYSFWWDTTEHDQVFRVYSRPHGIWLAAGPDRFEFPMQTREPVSKGALLVAAGASLVGIATGPTLNVVGFAQDTGISGAWIPVASCGIGWINCHVGADAAAGEAVTPLGAEAGRVRTANFGGASSATNALTVGALLDSAIAGQSWTGVTLHGFRAILWGPKSTQGFG